MNEYNTEQVQITRFPVKDGSKQVSLDILRLDLIHPVAGGNKIFKLSENLRQASQNGYHRIITFGGAFSNHIAATAWLCRQTGFAVNGIIRGEDDEANPTLRFARSCGMELTFLSRSEYKKLSVLPGSELQARYIGSWVIPEGGRNDAGVTGCSGIPVPDGYDVIALAAGTATTAAGIAKGGKGKVLAFPVLRNDRIHSDTEKGLMSELLSTIEFRHGYEFGGYAKINDVLVQFVRSVWKDHAIPLDFVYTGKALYGLLELIRSGYWNKETRILFVHTGGLQGNAGFVSRKKVDSLPKELTVY